MHQQYRAPQSPATRLRKSRHAEIARRYAAERKRKQGGAGVRLGELRKLFERRGVTKAQAAEHIDGLGPDLYAWSPVQLGQAVALTWVEQRKLRIRTFRCTDVSDRWIEEFWRRVKRRRDRQWRRAKRTSEPKVRRGLSLRARELFDLVGPRWIARSSLVDGAAALPSFCERGRPTDRSARLQAVRRALDELQEAHLVDVDGRTFNEHGQAIVTVRLHDV